MNDRVTMRNEVSDKGVFVRRKVYLCMYQRIYIPLLFYTTNKRILQFAFHQTTRIQAHQYSIMAYSQYGVISGRCEQPKFTLWGAIMHCHFHWHFIVSRHYNWLLELRNYSLSTDRRHMNIFRSIDACFNSIRVEK